MPRALRLSAVCLALACGPRPLPQPPARPREVLPPPAVAVPPDANFMLTVTEAVGNADEDTASYTRVAVDGKTVGETPVGPKSQEKRWGLRLPPGNHLFRFEKWNLPAAGEWNPLGAEWQPPERFIRVEEGARTGVALKFYDDGRGHSLEISRQPLKEER